MTSSRDRASTALVDATWSSIHESVLAAASKDLGRFRSAVLTFQDNAEAKDAAVRYVYYLLWRRLIGIAQRKPTPEDLERIAQDIYPKVTTVSTIEQSSLAGMLRDVFRKDGTPEGPMGYGFVIFGIAALAAMLEDPESDLADLRPYVDDWYQRKHAKVGSAPEAKGPPTS